MDELAPLPIGRRVAAFRKLRGLTQSGLAARMHRSESWVRKIERGERRIDSLSVLDELARALAVPVYQLTGLYELPPDQGGGRRPDLTELRRLLARPAIARPPDREPRPLVELRRGVAALTTRYNTATNHVSALLPDLADQIGEVQTAVRLGPEADRASAYAELAELYRLGAAVLRHSGDIPQARVASDRALAAAEQSGDPLRVGVVSVFHCMQLQATGDGADAVAVALDVADVVARDPRVDTPDGAVVLGGLYGYAAMAASGLGDGAEASQLLKAAGKASEIIGRDHEAYGMHFGPANLASKRMNALLRLDQPRDAVDAVEGLRWAQLGAKYRTGHHCVALATALSRCGEDDRALAALANGLRWAPEVVRYHPLARELVRDMLHRRRSADELLRRIAREMGVPDRP